ncbi:MAG TPA: hypothetical protein VG435_06825 [Acidimicrobiales bacterium]|jgi:hypothetical protein|nr:hypothetical protein [Acidimicrobiales bacterium]
MPFVPDDFDVPTAAGTDRFVLEPLDVMHNEADLAAWSSSIDHIRATPGFPDGDWPPLAGMSSDRNRSDLARHADDFAQRRGFTYTVLDPADGRVIGCLYIYPSKKDGHEAEVSSWVSAERAELDGPLYRFVSDWLDRGWPFTSVDYGPRPAGT